MDFNKVQNTKLKDVERPPLLPAVMYIWQVKELPSVEDSADGKWKFVTFKMQAVGVGPDVDPDLIREYGTLDSAVRSIRFIYNNEESEDFADNARTTFNLRTFLEKSLGLDADQSIKEHMTSCVGARCMAPIKWRTDKNDPDRVYDEIGKTAPLE